MKGLTKGLIGTPCFTAFSKPRINKTLFKAGLYDKLSNKAKLKLKVINLYDSGRYTLEQICDIFEINRSTLYRWRKRYNPKIVQTLEDKNRRPKRFRQKVARSYKVEHQVCEIRRKYPYFGKEKIKRILERDFGINVSVSSVGRILTQYKSILPAIKKTKKAAKTRKENKIRIKEVTANLKGGISELIQADTIELRLRFAKIYLFSAIDIVSKLLYSRAYISNSSLNAKDFLQRLNYIHDNRIKYLQLDNGSEFEGHFREEAKQQKITLIHNYPKTPEMNCYVEKVNDTIQTEYLDKFHDETSVTEINKILLDCLIEYNFYRPHRNLNLLTPIEYCDKLLYNNKNTKMVHMYRTHS